MKINVAEIDREKFHVNERTIPGLGDFILIVPFKAMWDWSEADLHMRSLLCRSDGTVVSSGFPKFFNFGEKPSHDAITLTGFADGSTVCTMKVDGSLIIRSVIDGKVHFRTRGCEIIATDMRDAVERLIAENYPQLLDPSIGVSNASFLIEYIAPSNQIVVKYARSELIGLGWVHFGGDKLIFRSDTFPGVKHVETLSLPRDVKELRNIVAAFDDQEGIVTWTFQADGSIHMSKFKSAWYLRLHALRSQATPRYLKEFCYFNKITTLDQLRDAFYREGFDWEIVSYIEPIFHELRQEIDAINKKIAAADKVVIQLAPGLTRKDIALALQQHTSSSDGMFGYMMARAMGENLKAEEAADALRLGMGLSQFRSFKKTGIEKLGSGSIIDDG